MSMTPAPTTVEPISESAKLAGLVKPLTWPAECPLGQRVHSSGGLTRYTIAYYGGDIGDAIYRWAPEKGSWSEHYNDFSDAKSEAQADYARRILSALDLSLITQQAADIAEEKRESASYHRFWVDELDKRRASESREAALIERCRVMSEALDELSAHRIEKIIAAHVRVRVDFPADLTRVEILGRGTAASVIAAAINTARAHNPPQGE